MGVSMVFEKRGMFVHCIKKGIAGAPIFLVMLFFLLHLGCTQKKEYIYEECKKINKDNCRIRLKANVVKDLNLVMPTSIGVVGNHLVVIDIKSDRIIHLIDMSSFELVKSFSCLGQGPSEFISPSDIIPDPHDKDAFWVYDLSTATLKKFSIKRIISNDSVPLSIIKFPIEKAGIPAQVMFFGNTRIVGIGLFLDCRLAIYSKGGKFLQKIGKVPVISGDLKFASQHSHGFIGRIAVDTSNRIILVATRYGSIIEKYNIDSGLVDAYIGPDDFYPEYNIVPGGSRYTMSYNKYTRFGYLDVAFSSKKNLFYMLYSGKNRINRNGKRNKEAHTGERVLLMNSKGDLKDIVSLDKSIYRITTIQDGSRIFGINEDEGILVFKYEGIGIY